MSATGLVNRSLGPQRVDGLKTEALFENDDLRVGRWRCLETSPRISCSRVIGYHVISFVHKGAFRLHARSHTSLIDPNRVVFLHPELPYQTSHPCGCGDTGSSLALSFDVLRDLWRAHDVELGEPAGSFVDAYGPCPPRVQLQQAALARALVAGNAPCAIAVEEKVLDIVDGVMAAYARLRRHNARPLKHDDRHRREVVEAAQVFIALHLGEHLQLGEIAAAAGTSVSSLWRLFVAETGEPVHRYLLRLRLRNALDRLEDGGCDITTLAYDLGFSSSSHLTMAFHREFSLTPSTWRGAGARTSAIVEPMANEASSRRPRRLRLGAQPQSAAAGSGDGLNSA
jgi:AraC family transcriptional regulator